MRVARWAILSMGLLGAGCLREPAGPTWDWDAEADEAEARAFLARWKTLNAKDDAASQLGRAALALEALQGGLSRKLPGLQSETLAAQGRQDAAKAAAAAPQDPRAWRLVSAYAAREGDLATATQAACKASDLAPKAADDAQTCGDLLARGGDAAGAVQRYRQAFQASADREQQFELLDRIQKTSLTPSTDLEALPKEVVDQYKAHRGVHRNMEK